MLHSDICWVEVRAMLRMCLSWSQPQPDLQFVREGTEQQSPVFIITVESILALKKEVVVKSCEGIGASCEGAPVQI